MRQTPVCTALVTMYAQSRSIDHYQAMRRDLGPLPFLQEALTIAKFEPGVYEIVRTFAPIGQLKDAIVTPAFELALAMSIDKAPAREPGSVISSLR